MRLPNSVKAPIILAAFCWLLELVEMGFETDFHHLGIYPRHFTGMIGILFHPFLHGGIQHLASNTFSFIFLLGSILFFYPLIAKQVIIRIYFITGIGVWLLARPAYHIGASGIIYGFASFLFFIGLLQKNPSSLIVSLVIALLYNSMLYGLLPSEEGVSWESHLIGAIVGAMVAYSFRNSAIESTPEHKTTRIGEMQFEGVVPLETNSFRYNYKEKNSTDESTENVFTIKSNF